MKRKQQFVMENPRYDIDRRMWEFRLFADPAVFQQLSGLDCVLSILLLSDSTVGYVYLDPRYDYEEAWLTIYEWLELETAAPDVELWGDALPD